MLESATFTSSGGDLFAIFYAKENYPSLSCVARRFDERPNGNKEKVYERQSRDAKRTNCIYESNSLAISLASEVSAAVFDISIPRLTEDTFEMSFMRAGISGIVARINDCNRSLSCAS